MRYMIHLYVVFIATLTSLFATFEAKIIFVYRLFRTVRTQWDK